MPDVTISLGEAKAHLSELADRASAGESVVSIRNGKAVAWNDDHVDKVGHLHRDMGYLTHHLKIDKYTFSFWEGDKIDAKGAINEHPNMLEEAAELGRRAVSEPWEGKG